MQQLVHTNEVMLTAEDALKQSSLTVVGSVVTVTDGRAVLEHPSAEPMQTLVATVDVDDVVQGMAGERVYVEFLRGYAELDVSKLALPSGRLLLILADANSRWSPAPTFRGAGTGVPAGEVLYRLVSSQGLLQESAGGLTQPFAGLSTERLFTGAGASLDAVVSAIESGQLAAVGGTTGDSRARAIERARAAFERLPAQARDAVTRAPAPVVSGPGTPPVR